jgi:hypothetical protein
VHPDPITASRLRGRYGRFKRICAANLDRFERKTFPHYIEETQTDQTFQR